MIDYELIYERKQHYLTIPQDNNRKLCFGNESITKAYTVSLVEQTGFKINPEFALKTQADFKTDAEKAKWMVKTWS